MNANRTNTARGLRACTGTRRAVTGVALLLLALTGLSPSYSVAAQQVTAAHRRTILVLPFDLYDFSLDQRPVTVVPLRRWVAAFAGQVSHQLRHDAALRVLGGRASAAAFRKVHEDYRHPTTCHACMISIARRAGADMVVIGQVRKLSNLITFFTAQVDDVRTGRVLHDVNMRADGADTDVMWKHIAQSVAHRIEHAVRGAR